MKKPNTYQHTAIESKWQAHWTKTKLHQPDLKKAKNKFYNLFMFPYPSAEGLHAGHAFASTGSDIYGRFMRMQGRNVFQPIGYDSFGIHSENFAIKIGDNPRVFTQRATRHYEEQLRMIGHGYDWSRTVTTSDVNYYKWTQWLFLQMFKAGLAYKKKAAVNFCPSCKTVLADEQVIDGRCERCGTEVVKRQLEQWFFKITQYADRLLTGLDKINWSQRVITAQRNWIGKSAGMIIRFKGEDGGVIEVFTTRPDTLNAATFLATSKLYKEGSKEKVGKFSGKYAINPLNNRRLPIWDTNYVTPDYGTGIIMGVPAHDERDGEFAKKYQLDIVNQKPDQKLWSLVEKKGWGEKHTNYHLRDWLVSRQRYWGAPIPMIHCPKCEWQAVPESKLPVLLPDIADYKPEGTGKGPLANHAEFYRVKCSKCGGEATRETDVMDTFVDSSWYFLRYPSVGSAKASKIAFDPDITRNWLPVDLYFGGAEHAVLHLMYARFVTMVLYDLKLINFEEPFPRFFAHGLMIKDGAKMSKSRGNVVNPDEYVKKFGADTLRLYLMFMGPMDGYPDFRDTGIEGMQRFLRRVWKLFRDYKDVVLTGQKESQEVLVKMHQTIKKVSEDLENFHYNTAISSLMELVNLLYDKKGKSHPQSNVRCAEWDQTLENLTKLFAPFAPHLAEEIWVEILGQKGSVHESSWPKYDSRLAEEEKKIVVVQINGKVRGQLTVGEDQPTEEKITRLAQKDSKISKWLVGSKIKKTIYVPGKVINFVV